MLLYTTHYTPNSTQNSIEITFMCAITALLVDAVTAVNNNSANCNRTGPPSKVKLTKLDRLKSWTVQKKEPILSFNGWGLNGFWCHVKYIGYNLQNKFLTSKVLQTLLQCSLRSETPTQQAWLFPKTILKEFILMMLWHLRNWTDYNLGQCKRKSKFWA